MEDAETPVHLWRDGREVLRPPLSHSGSYGLYQQSASEERQSLEVI